ncbi:MAG: response regulator transcription factor [Verrucomicrobiales bacterium]|nr:response regulator transcription factor [Verrucomicrobiales bacterium]
MKSDTVRCVLLADRHHGLTEGIRGLLETSFDAVVMVADETSFLESAERLRPNVVVADLALATGESFGWLRRLLARCPESRVIVLSTHDEPTVVQAALEAGASGFVIKREITSQLLDAVEAVLGGKRYVPPGKAGRVLPPDEPQGGNTEKKHEADNA